MNRSFAGIAVLFLLAAAPLVAEELTVAEQDKRDSIANINRTFVETLKAIPTQVTGQAMLPDGKPAVGFKIGGWGRSITNRGWGHGISIFDIVTDENGRFSLDLYRPCLYWITIDDPNHVYVSADRHFELTEPLGPDAIRFQLQKGVPIEGIVIDKDKNEPIVGLDVLLLHEPVHLKEMDPEDRWEHEKKQQCVRDMETDKQGRFKFAALPNEKYMVSFDQIHDSQPPEETVAAIYTRTFTPGKETVRLEFRIPTPWRGRLLQKDGTPASGFPVFIMMRFDYGSYAFTPITDKEGYFMYYRPVPVEALSVDTFKHRQWFYRDFRGETLPSDPVFQLSAPLTAAGRLVRKSTGQPMKNFKFAYRPRPYTDQVVSTDENGNFELTKLYLDTQVRLCFLNEPDNLDTCSLYEEFHIFTPTEPDKVVDLGVIELEESGWLDPNSLQNLPGKEIIIDGTTLAGQVFDWKQYAGKVVLIDFWATWCAPCLEELPRLKTLYEKYHGNGFEIVGISVDEDLAVLEKGLEKHQFPWTILADAKRKEADQITMGNRFAIGNVPRGILVNRDGKVVSIEARGETLEAELERLFSD
jgi:thiol-disulfide isomerase/thioredoxin